MSYLTEVNVRPMAYKRSTSHCPICRRTTKAMALDRLLVVDVSEEDEHLCCWKPMEKVLGMAAWECVVCGQVLELGYVRSLRKQWREGL